VRKEILDAIIEERCLLKHPFYQAWNMGTLSHDDLAVYATQYGEFIDRIASGWEVAGDPEVAAEEREHAVLWTDFATGLNAPRPAASRLAEVEALVRTANTMFTNRPQALGALYAFEHQQPATAKSKLEGLRRHYNLSPDAEVYFDIHQDDEEEPRWLAQQMETLSDAEFALSTHACEQMANALWRALDGVMLEIGKVN